MRVYEVSESGPLVERLYQEVLKPSFPAAELVDIEEFQEIAASADDSIWLAEDEDGRILGCATAEWDEDLRILLLGYLAVRPGERGGGIGGPLYTAALESWRLKFKPCLVLAEIEDPAAHEASEEHGDPSARLRFYLRHGSRVMDLPYFQPALGPDQERIAGLLLIVLHVDPEFTGAKPGTVKADIVRKFVEDYQVRYEGRIATDEQAAELWRALDHPDGVRLRPV